MPWELVMWSCKKKLGLRVVKFCLILLRLLIQRFPGNWWCYLCTKKWALGCSSSATTAATTCSKIPWELVMRLCKKKWDFPPSGQVPQWLLRPLLKGGHKNKIMYICVGTYLCKSVRKISSKKTVFGDTFCNIAFSGVLKGSLLCYSLRKEQCWPLRSGLGKFF
jgi:hypothetical protein